ncbi:glycine-rich RNA-binding protein 3, mitochondrial-like isoform X2 [Tripterygium wilfordii]|uniref:glycine-rich RNA-binding protein 3, mitochondrial-like isoform X2 n=1 Tax=Tripterygium wilfordii TaxID=458696 RepID=UPI0018F842D4|nr:glycine-rich RNA-binding protein 3, mitochondrial-like isoform X2 [Tripterygium wilfordii]
MAFLSKVGNILRQTATKQVNAEFSASRPSIYQAIRCMSSSKLFVGGISFNTDDSGLREAFGKYGEVVEARIIQDRETGRSRGFGFVTYTSSEDASSAIQALDGQDLDGRQIRVNYATDRPRPAYNQGYGGGGGGYNQGYGGGGYGGNTSGDGFGSRGNYGNDSFVSGDGSYGGNVSSASGGFDGSSGLGFGGNEGNSMDNAAGDLNSGEPLDGNYRDNFDDSGDFAKRA